MASSGIADFYRWLGEHAPVQEASTSVKVAFTAGIVLALFLASQLDLSSGKGEQETGTVTVSDPGLLRNHSTFESYQTSKYTYPRIRTFFHPHPQAAALSLETPLPLLVFIHGLGGSIAQFAPLLTHLVNNAPCLAIDLPGCGLSDFEPKRTGAYRIEDLARLHAAAIEKYRDAEKGQRVVLIGHSMGCSIAALLASSSSPLAALANEHFIGVIAICAKSASSEMEYAQIRRLRYVPEWLFNVFRRLDKRGGLESKSVTRVVGEGADVETRKLQLRYNEQSRTPAFMRVIIGWLPDRDRSGGFPGLDVWSGMKVPLFLIAGESDSITPPRNVDEIAKALVHPDQARNNVQNTEGGGSLPAVAGDVQSAKELVAQTATTDQVKADAAKDPKPNTAVKETDTATKHSMALKTTIFPPPAAHGLLYASGSVRILSGLIQAFLGHHIDNRLSLGWQLQHLTTEGKWEVKNLEKWQTVDPVSKPIGGLFRAMKTLREADDVHCPKAFTARWSMGKVDMGVKMVVDISHDSPVYDPKGLEMGGVEYHKFPTVSKLPPVAEEVEAFIALIDRLRLELPEDKEAGQPEQWQPGKPKPTTYAATIGVHCHYGFNRTGFFIVCYLVERLGYKLQDALTELAEKRKPGIKHGYFVDELFVRYAVKLDRGGTIVA